MKRLSYESPGTTPKRETKRSKSLSQLDPSLKQGGRGLFRSCSDEQPMEHDGASQANDEKIPLTSPAGNAFPLPSACSSVHYWIITYFPIFFLDLGIFFHLDSFPKKKHHSIAYLSDFSNFYNPLVESGYHNTMILARNAFVIVIICILTWAPCPCLYVYFI